MLTQIAACGELFHSATGTAFADLMVDGHRETWPIRSKRFRGWLRRRYYEATGGALNGQAISLELDLLEARGQFDAPERSVHVRVAEEAGHIYLDLADEHWRAIEIGPDGWRVNKCPPVRFRRPAGMLPLPIPQPEGSIEALLPLLNLSSQNDFALVVAWLLATLRPSGPYPLLAISGEQGSAKTVLSKMLKALVDPNVAPVRALPREQRELMIAANNGHLLAFDNLSNVPPWLSDALCRLASGGSFAVRQLYTDDDEVLFQASRPLLVNGIEEVITRPDLADRSIFLTLPPVAAAQRQSERELWRQFELARPCILGGLLDLVVHGLRTLPGLGLARLPRMADFAVWVAACETAVWPAGTFGRAYEANRRTAAETSIEADPVAVCVREIMAERSSWTGTAADLLRAGAGPNSNGTSRDGTGWPKNPRALAGRLRRAQTFLRVLGIEIAFSREGLAGSRMIRIRATREVPSVPSAASATDLRHDLPVPSAMAPVALIWSIGTRSTKSLQSPTMLTVLTQMPPFVSGNPEWTYGHPDGPSRRPFGMSPGCRRSQLPAAWQRQAAALLESRGIASFPKSTSHISISMIWVSV
jgi:hypothetical protein